MVRVIGTGRIGGKAEIRPRARPAVLPIPPYLPIDRQVCPKKWQLPHRMANLVEKRCARAELL